VGSFLSGGIDSTLITALAQKCSHSPVSTYTIGFSEADYDESVYAREIAKYLGTSHNEWIVTQADVLNIVPSLAHIYDEPFADASQLPTTLLAQKARLDVKVCLSGDGGDELFGGYNRYVFGPKLHKNLRVLPLALRKSIAKLYHSRNPQTWLNLHEKILGWRGLPPPNLSEKLSKFMAVSCCETEEHMFDLLLSTWPNESGVVSGTSCTSFDYNFKTALKFSEKMMMHDAGHYLVDDVMTKVDRAAMSCGLEVRAPFLDHDVFNYAWNMPLDQKINNGVGKAPLRDLLFKLVPRNLLERPKAGFSVPLEHWLRNDLRDMAESYLSHESLSRHGYLNTTMIREMWHQHLDGSSNHQYKLWNVIVFQQWYDDWTR